MEQEAVRFTLRNSLINFRVNSSVIQLMINNVDILEDNLSDGKSFQLKEILSDWSKTLRDAKIVEVDSMSELIERTSAAELKSGRIRTFLNSSELNTNMKGLYRKAQNAMDENGSNTLFLSLGLLRWFTDDNDDIARYAPLIMLPVEIYRKAKEGAYYLRLRDEEPQVNITLLEFLKQQFGIKIGGLDPMPLDDKGVDVAKVFAIIRKAVMGQKRWDVENFAFLGIFSFSQFVMWNDIQNNGDMLRGSKIVNSLIEGKLTYVPEGKFINAKEIDENVKPIDLGIVSSVDSSQIEAVYASDCLESFVLHGPPGTGKSQTITNIISNALYKNRRVLFVAEKAAALEVVRNRLNNLGLLPFCLELHSNKAQKRIMLDQLEGTLNYVGKNSSEDFSRKAEELFKKRKDLNGIVSALNKKGGNGFSIYDLILMYNQVNTNIEIPVEYEFIEKCTKADFENMDHMIRQLMGSVKNSKHQIHNHPLKDFRKSSYSILEKENLPNLLNKLNSDLGELIESGLIPEQITKIKSENKLKSFLDLYKSVDFELLVKYVDKDIFDYALNNDITFVDDANKVIGELDDIERNIYEKYAQGISNLDFRGINQDYINAKKTFIISRKKNISEVLQKINYYSKSTHKVSTENADLELSYLINYQDKRKEVESSIKKISSAFNKDSTEISKLKNVVKGAIYCREIASKFMELGFDSKDIFQFYDFLIRKSNHVEAFLSSINETMDILYSDYGVGIDNSGDLKKLKQKVIGWIENIGSWKNWSDYRSECERIESQGLFKIIEKIENSACPPEEILDAWRKGFAHNAISYSMKSEHKVLSRFNGRRFEEEISYYRTKNEEYVELTKEEIQARMYGRLYIALRKPELAEEVSKLLRTIKNKGRMTSLRKLFREIPNLLKEISPVMLMSPISVAQYLDKDFPKFDLVIFDEASQIPTSIAVGSIARGDNSIIVGDPKQLPPTGFFKTTYIDEDNFDLEDLESLLDDCLALNMPQKYLKWHYRSQSESLIAFSNYQYYDSSLLTFPTLDAQTSKVSLVKVDGVYDKGNTRTNLEEAKAVVSEIVSRLRNEKLRNISIGVVTFNSQQQNLIDDLLVEEMKNSPVLADHITNMAEPVFIKNLENVQGDERDVILFSIGYGPDEEGKLSMNFGPLNRDGGWRRLNVAITRARKEMIIFSTITFDQIDLKRTRSDGVHGLKGFLEFAQMGTGISGIQISKSDSDNYLLKRIKLFVESNGYETVIKVGKSNYQLDLVIKDRNNPDIYLMALIFDGQSYSAAGTSRDRNILQPSILKNIGWKVYYIWAMDWLDNSSEEEKKLISAINKAQYSSQTPTKKTILKDIEKNVIEQGSSENLQSEYITTIPNLNRVDSLVDLESNIKVTELNKVSELLSMENPSIENVKVASVNHPSTEVQKSISEIRTPYISITFNNLYLSEDFYNSKSLTCIIETMEAIIDLEAPIYKEYMFNKVLPVWGISRRGKNIDQILDRAYKKVKCKKIREGADTLLWSNELDKDNYLIYRYNADGESIRPFDAVPNIELRNCVIGVLSKVDSMEPDDLMKEVTINLGYGRLLKPIKERLLELLKKLRREKEVSMIGKYYTTAKADEGYEDD